MQITNGTITYSHVIKIEDFGVNKKAETSLSFALAEGEAVDAAVEFINKLVKGNVSKMLYAEKVGAKAADPKPAEKPTEAKTPAKAAGPRKAETPKPETKPEPAKPTAAADAASVVEEEAEDFSATPATPTATVKEIPDADLASAMTKKNAEIKNSQAIRELVG